MSTCGKPALGAIGVASGASRRTPSIESGEGSGSPPRAASGLACETAAGEPPREHLELMSKDEQFDFSFEVATS
jgi:hypothetical protein